MMFAAELSVMPWDIGKLDYEQLSSAVGKFDEMIAEAAERSAASS